MHDEKWIEKTQVANPVEQGTAVVPTSRGHRAARRSGALEGRINSYRYLSLKKARDA
ncbi:MAG: hypothetical protein JSS01_07815 [Proteobacteria bacterium]|nr:hypothetical protein [Pseudomonadota bacterium]